MSRGCICDIAREGVKYEMIEYIEAGRHAEYQMSAASTSEGSQSVKSGVPIRQGVGGEDRGTGRRGQGGDQYQARVFLGACNVCHMVDHMVRHCSGFKEQGAWLR